MAEKRKFSWGFLQGITLRRQNQEGVSMPPTGHAEWEMSVSRWKINRPSDSGGDGKDAPKQI
jgi:hypothetical protein